LHLRNTRSATERRRNIVMGVKAPAVRRTDSVYAQLGGKANIAAIVDRFYEKMLADPDIRPQLAKANLASLKQRQAQFLTQSLGGPVEAKNRVTAPAHAHLLTQARHVERATTHLALALSEMNMGARSRGRRDGTRRVRAGRIVREQHWHWIFRRGRRR
jgi:hemoglobin